MITAVLKFSCDFGFMATNKNIITLLLNVVSCCVQTKRYGNKYCVQPDNSYVEMAETCSCDV